MPLRFAFILLAPGLLNGCLVYDQSLIDDALGGSGGAASGGTPQVGDGDGVVEAPAGVGGGTGGAGDVIAGGSGGSPSGGMGGVVGSGGSSGPTDRESLVEDFNDQNQFISPPDSDDDHGRFGQWLAQHDMTSGTMTPGKGDPFAVAQVDGVDYALRVTATGFTDWGAGFYADLNNNNAYDLTGRGYEAIRFRARIESGTHAVMQVEISDERSSLSGSCGDLPGGCDYDHAGAQVLLSSEWKDYEVKFSTMRRLSSPDPREFDKAYEIHFLMASDNIDFWIDDIRFVDLAE